MSETLSINISELSECSTIKDLIEWGLAQYAEHSSYLGHGFEAPVDEVIALVFKAMDLPLDAEDVPLDHIVSTEQKASLANSFRRRLEQREPLAYITNQAWFAGMPYFVDERVLIPRSPFAEIIQTQISLWRELEGIGRVMDLCTGSACIAIACALEFQNARVDALDISKDALAVAEINVKNYALENRVKLLQSDVLDALSQDEYLGKYDLILSNPPYVDAEDMSVLPDEYRHEPSLALAAGTDGLDIVKRILKDAAKHLKPKGLLIVEVGNSEYALAEAFPELPFLWLEFEYGGHGVFMLTREQLLEHQMCF